MNKEKMTVLFDLDQVLCDWSKEMDIRLDIIDPERRIKRMEDSEYFDIKIERSASDAETVFGIMSMPGFYRNLEPLHDGIEAIQKAAQKYEVFIVSTPTFSNPTCSSDKTAWVEEHLGRYFSERLILTKDKTLVLGAVLLDDKPEITGSRIYPFWEHVVVSRPWNRHVKDKKRLDSWDQLDDILEEIKERTYWV